MACFEALYSIPSLKSQLKNLMFSTIVLCLIICLSIITQWIIYFVVNDYKISQSK